MKKFSNKSRLKFTALLVVGIITMLACGTPVPEPKTSGELLERYGGDALAYEVVDDVNDCEPLQEMFSDYYNANQSATAGSPKAKRFLGYMIYVGDKLEKLGCPGW